MDGQADSRHVVRPVPPVILMNGRSILTASIALVVVASVGGVGLGAASTASATGPAVAQQGTGTPTGTAGANASSGPFRLTVANISSCGTTCRLVTANITNSGNTAARNVTVNTTVSAGDTVIARRHARVGRLGPNETASRTIRITVSYGDVSAIQNNGGNITVRSVVTSDRHRQTFVTNRSVL